MYEFRFGFTGQSVQDWLGPNGMKTASKKFASSFKRSKKGNLWRRYQNRTLVVFARQESFAWGQFSADKEEYSSESFETEDEAIEDLRQWLENYVWDSW